MIKRSYSAADVDIPVKILHDTVLMESLINDKKVLCRHLQLCLTNRCNLSCSYCSCGDRDRSIEMPLPNVSKLLNRVSSLGCRAITITGGGEPLLYPHINEVIKHCNEIGIRVGLVTNGLALDNLKEKPDWIRVSFDSQRKFKSLGTILGRALIRLPNVDWAFSFVALDRLGELSKVVNYANANRFTHVRVVSDILNPSDVAIAMAKMKLRGKDYKVVYQARTKPTKGRQKCFISLLKPTIAADGLIYPCCGAQYAIKDRKHDFHELMSMGTMDRDLVDVISKQIYFDGSVCDRCYYDNYNEMLGLLMDEVKHKEWV